MGSTSSARLLAAVTPDDLAATTPCSDWTVADLSDHIVNSTAGMATMAQGGEPDWSANPHHDDPAAALEEQARALVEALARRDSSFPEGMAAGELAVHAYDLATALGRDTADLDPEVAEVGLRLHEHVADRRQARRRLRARAAAPDGADAYQRLAAFAGRSV